MSFYVQNVTTRKQKIKKIFAVATLIVSTDHPNPKFPLLYKWTRIPRQKNFFLKQQNINHVIIVRLIPTILQNFHVYSLRSRLYNPIYLFILKK